MQAMRIVEHQLDALGVVGRRGMDDRGRAGGGRRAGIAVEHVHDRQRIARREQLLQACRIADQARQPLQQHDVLVRLRGDRDHQAGALAVAPFDAIGQLQHGHAGAADQVTVLLQAMRDRHAMAEIGVRHLLAAVQAGHVGRLDHAGLDQQRAGLVDRIVAGGGPGGEPDLPRGKQGRHRVS